MCMCMQVILYAFNIGHFPNSPPLGIVVVTPKTQLYKRFATDAQFWDIPSPTSQKMPPGGLNSLLGLCIIGNLNQDVGSYLGRCRIVREFKVLGKCMDSFDVCRSFPNLCRILQGVGFSKNRHKIGNGRTSYNT